VIKLSGRFLGKLALAGAGGLLLIQLVPYGREHINPPVIREPAWDSPGTRTLAKQACFDCHSHETVWPWYSKIAPLSWLVQYDVNEGRKELNFSDWQGKREGERPDKIGKEVAEGEMPPLQYLINHAGARLSAADKQRLIDGLTTTAGRR